MKVFVFFGISLAKTGVFIDIYTYLQLSFSIQVYPIRCLLLSFLLITVAQLEQSKRGGLPLIIIVSNMRNKKVSERNMKFSVLVCDCLIIQFKEVCTYALISNFQGIQVLKFKGQKGFLTGLEFLRSQGVQGFLEVLGSQRSQGSPIFLSCHNTYTS